jgi:hypothetical protein
VDTAALHRSAVEELAAESQSPIELVQKLYQNELTALEPQAKIHLYLPLIVRRKVRDVLRQRQEFIKVSRRESDQVVG